MANQIARFFDSQPGDAAAQTAQHLKNFWDPSMRRALLSLQHAGGDELSPTVQAAAGLLAAELGDDVAANGLGQKTPG